MAVVTSQPRYATRNGFGVAADDRNSVRLSAIGGDYGESRTGATELEYAESLHVDEDMRKDVKGTYTMRLVQQITQTR